MIRIAATLIGLTLGVHGPAAYAQGLDDSGLSQSQTARVVSTIEDMYGHCKELDDIYRPDCVGKALQRGASKISNNPSFWEADVALTRAVRSLSALVRANTDASESSVRANGYRLKPVTRANFAEISAQGQAIFQRLVDDLTTSNRAEIIAFSPIIETVENGRPWP